MVLDPSWSLNRVLIVDLPSQRLPDEVKGKTAYELVSAKRFTQLIRERSDVLQLDSSQSDHALRLDFHSCLCSRKPATQDAAVEIVRILGRNLGYVLLTLKRGDPINRAARSEWKESHWQHWSRIKRLWLGGGLMSGSVGVELVRHASQVLREGDIDDLLLRISPYGLALPLIGAARHVPSGVAAAIALDFGGTMIKRAHVVFEDSRIARVCQLSSQPVCWASVRSLRETTPQAVQGLISGMASVTAKTWMRGQMKGQALARTIPICIAAYVQGGNPMHTQAGTYMQTNLVADNLEDTLGQMVSDNVGEPISVKLLHDGTAAAAVYAGEPHTAVITLGTALGIGFPGEESALRPLTSEIVIC